MCLDQEFYDRSHVLYRTECPKLRPGRTSFLKKSLDSFPGGGGSARMEQGQAVQGLHDVASLEELDKLVEKKLPLSILGALVFLARPRDTATQHFTSLHR